MLLSRPVNNWKHFFCSVSYLPAFNVKPDPSRCKCGSLVVTCAGSSEMLCFDLIWLLAFFRCLAESSRVMINKGIQVSLFCYLG